MKWLRRFLAALVLVSLVLTFVIPGTLLSLYLGLLTRVQLVPAVLTGSLIILSALGLSVVLFGRLYCSLVCPLGIAQDWARAFLSVLHLVRRAPSAPASRRTSAVRFAVLGLFVIGGFAGLAVPLLEPYGIFGRFLSVGVMRFGEPEPLVLAWSVGLFALILVATFLRARFWCNLICPVGTFLGLFSRFALVRVRIDSSKCVKCGLCAKACDKGAICRGADGAIAVDASKCVTCLNCAGVCGKDALKWL